MIYTVIWAHFVCDFILQTDAMAKGKSSSNAWLGKHIATYTTMLCIPVLFLAPNTWRGVGSVFLYCAVNGLAHFATDYVSSRMTKKLWEQKRTHAFFVVIGADQAIHLTTLVATLPLLRA